MNQSNHQSILDVPLKGFDSWEGQKRLPRHTQTSPTEGVSCPSSVETGSEVKDEDVSSSSRPPLPSPGATRKDYTRVTTRTRTGSKGPYTTLESFEVVCRVWNRKGNFEKPVRQQPRLTMDRGVRRHSSFGVCLRGSLSENRDRLEATSTYFYWDINDWDWEETPPRNFLGSTQDERDCVVTSPDGDSTLTLVSLNFVGPQG